MAPKKKGQKMDLGAFLLDESTGGSWADEMDALPTGPSGDPGFGGGGLGGSHLSRNNQGGDRGGFGDRPGRGGGGDFGDRPPRAEVPIPTAPPYTAFVGNLSFEIGEIDLENFFQGLTTTSIRLVSGHDGKPKGFGYVEFSTVDDLKSALSLSGTDMGSRPLRISVAEAPKDREGRADQDATWTRSGPLAPLAGSGGRSGGFGSGGGRDGGGGFGGQRGGLEGPEVEREGPIRGGKFVPSASGTMISDGPRRPGGFDRASSGSFRDRDSSGPPMEVEREREGPIRGGKFVPAPPAPERGNGGGGGFGGERRASGPGPAEEEKTWTRQGPLPPLANQGGQRSASGFGGPRSSGGFTPPSGDVSPQLQRKPLQLSARSTSTSSEVSPSPTPNPNSTSTTNKPSPFGTAKPIDSAEREALAEAKLLKDRETIQAKLAAEKERREKELSEKKAKVGAGAGASPFGAAKPVDVSAKEKEVEDKIAAARKVAPTVVRAPSASGPPITTAQPATTSSTPTSPTPDGPATAAFKTALRKEGFSYSSIAKPEDKAVEEVTKKVEGATI